MLGQAINTACQCGNGGTSDRYANWSVWGLCEKENQHEQKNTMDGNL